MNSRIPDTALSAMFAGDAPFTIRGLRTDYSPSRAPEPNQALCVQLAEEKVCQDVGLIADWIAGSDDVREMSAYFGEISTPEIVRLMFNGRCNKDQALAAITELRKRFVADKQEFIAEQTAQIAQES